MDRQLTIADVFNPLDSAIKVQQLDEMRTRSRLQAMQMEETQKTQAAKNEIAGMWQSLSGGQPQAGPQVPGGTSLPQPQMQQMRPSPQQAPQQQPGSQNPAAQRFANYTKIFNYAVQSGNDQMMQNVFREASDDPEIGPKLKQSGLMALSTTGMGELEQVVQLDDQKAQGLIQKFPQLKDGYSKPGPYKLATKNGIPTKFEPVKDVATDKLTDEQIVHGALKEKLKREPTKQELLKAVEEHKKSTSAFGSTVPFADWSKDEKEFWYESKQKTGEGPRFGFGDKISYNQFNKGYANYLKGKGISPTGAATEKETFKADAASIKNQTKVRDMMGSFTKNLDFQVSRLTDRIDKISRTDVRILNLPIREAMMRIKGSANESILSMYLTDISNDIAKLSTGSSASVAELSQSAQERWSKIHDPNLSIKDILSLISETKIAAHGRMQTADQQISETRQRMRTGDAAPETKKETPIKKEGKKIGRFTIEEE